MNLIEQAAVLEAALTIWARRDQPTAPPKVRLAAGEAVDTIDDMLASLHKIRADLTIQARQYDDATAARVDKMLTQRSTNIT